MKRGEKNKNIGIMQGEPVTDIQLLDLHSRPFAQSVL
jgi:hypothetical protein